MTTPSKELLIAEANKDVTVAPNYVSVLYGDYGNRKTTTACSMIKERGLLISSDESWKVLLNDRHKEIYAKVKDSIKGYEGVAQLEYIDFEGYDTIIWDTLSRSVAMFLDLLHDEAKWSGKNREQLITSNEELKGTETLGFVDYRVTRDKFRPVINRLLKTTNSHIIFTSLMTTPIPNMGNQQRRPAIPQATFDIVGEKADLIANCRVVGNKGIVDATNNLSQLGKSRFEGLQGQMDLDSFVSKYKEIVFK